MNFKHVKTVLKKELKDLLRDKRTWLASLLLPMLTFPLMFFLMGLGQRGLENTMAQAVPIAVEGKAYAPSLMAYLEKAEGIEIVETENPYGLLESGEVKVIMCLEEDFEKNLQAEVPAQVKLVYDEISNESSIGASNLQEVINNFSEAVRMERLSALGIDPQRLEPTIVTLQAHVPEGQESKGEGPMLMVVTFLLPFLLMLYPVVGGMPAAIDLGAGEKERLSLEPLLSTGADRLSILVGKYLTVLVTSIIGVITSLGGIYASAKIAPEMLPLGIKISPLSLLILVGISLTIAMILSGVMLAISVFAKSYKEAGTYLSPITLFLMVPTYLTMYMDIKRVSTGLFFVPLLNSVLLMKQVLVDIINPLHVVITFGVSLVLVVLSLLFVKYMFNKESVIFRS